MLTKAVAWPNDEREKCVWIVFLFESFGVELKGSLPHLRVKVDRADTAEHSCSGRNIVPVECVLVDCLTHNHRNGSVATQSLFECVEGVSAFLELLCGWQRKCLKGILRVRCAATCSVIVLSEHALTFLFDFGTALLVLPQFVIDPCEHRCTRLVSRQKETLHFVAKLINHRIIEIFHCNGSKSAVENVRTAFRLCIDCACGLPAVADEINHVLVQVLDSAFVVSLSGSGSIRSERIPNAPIGLSDNRQIELRKNLARFLRSQT
mmetsp:Transcript_140605/g.437300  ORF Transcript_140605/g.437300 Transcript_140605/m.437300 type:complete len:264 (-) Transcript_140605:226-1017(-)